VQKTPLLPFDRGHHALTRLRYNRRMTARKLAPIILSGLLVRLALIVASGWRIDYDEALNGLIARDLLRGDWHAFLPPEVVMGTGEAAALALVFVPLGASAFTIRLLALLLSAVYIATTALLARDAFGERVGLLAGLFAALGPPYLLVTGVKIWGGYASILALGGVFFLLLAGAIRRDDGRRLALAGFVGGVIFWTTFLSLYYLGVGAIVTLWWGRRTLRRALIPALIAFLIGSAPFWAFNIAHGFPTLTRLADDSAMSLGESLGVLGHFVTTLLPWLSGTYPAWTPDESLAGLLLAALYAVGSLLLIARARTVTARLLALLIPGALLIYAISPHSRNIWNPWGVDATGRYLLMLHTALPVALALLVDVLARRRMALGVALAGLVLALNLAGAARLDPLAAFNSPYYDRLPPTLDPLIDYLDAHDIRHVWTDAGLGQVLMFATGERILAADYYDSHMAGGVIRFPAALAAVERAERVAFVTPIYPGQPDPPLHRALDAAGVAYTVERVTPELAVYIPLRAIDPARVAAGMGWQY
jgi:hypothetical protein